MALEGSSRADLFRAFARDLLPQGVSGNLILQAARDAGIGINRANALGIIREERQASGVAFPPAFEPPSIEVITGGSVFRWGDAVQVTQQWSRFDGPSAILFQQNGPNADQWTDYLIPPEDEDVTAYRFIVADDEYVSEDGKQTGFRTSQSFDVSLPVSTALSRLGLSPDEVARIIYDRP